MAKSKYTKYEKRRCNKHKGDRLRLMPMLMDRQSGTCFWCKCEIRIPRDTQGAVLNEYNGVLTYLSESKEMRTVAIATLDHLEHLTAKATLDNTVAACQGCNCIRGQIANGFSKSAIRNTRRRFNRQGVAFVLPKRVGVS
jgi:hypothetical protein